jgi:hypothetical protein
MMCALAPTFHERLTAFATAALTGDLLADRERALAVLPTALVLADHGLIPQAVVGATPVGITHAEMGHTSALGLAVRGPWLAGPGQVTAPTAQTRPVTHTTWGS